MNSHRRQELKRSTEIKDRKKFVVIAMEGAKTEPHYFNEYLTLRDSKIQVKLVPMAQSKTRPQAVLERLTTIWFKKGYDRENDAGWLVIDRDAWPEEDLNAVCRQAHKHGFQVAVSNPCFEFWLYLHLRDACPFNDRNDCQNRLEKVLSGYSKGSYDVKKLLTGRDKAIERAKQLDTDPDQLWPKNQGTRVYQLVEMILER